MTVSTVNHSSCSKVQVYHASQASQPHQGGHYVSALHPARQKATHPICPNNVSLKKTTELWASFLEGHGWCKWMVRLEGSVEKHQEVYGRFINRLLLVSSSNWYLHFFITYLHILYFHYTPSTTSPLFLCISGHRALASALKTSCSVRRAFNWPSTTLALAKRWAQVASASWRPPRGYQQIAWGWKHWRMIF